MPRYRVRASADVAQLVKRLHPLLKAKVKVAFRTIVTDPYVGKGLKEELAGLRSYSVGRFRIVYRVQDERTIHIVALGPRRTIYEETFRLISREES